MRLWPCIVVLVACQGSSSKLQPSPAGSGAGSAAAPAAGSATAKLDAAKLDVVVGELAEYTDKLVPLALAWDGDCGKHIERLLALEPLVKQIRAHTDELEKIDPDAQTAIGAAFRQKKSQLEPRIDAQLAAAGKTRGDVDQVQVEIQKTCGSDPRLLDAMNRVGVFKKRH